MQTVNIGILAHVDAGKTSLTERLLFDTGVIDRLGSVDSGTTQTDTGEIERRRGITIRSAVAAFTVGDRQVNLIDTPGHSDFVAEVERALGVLDGAVLVLSAVEGVQPHTRVLMKTLRALRLPTLIFVNKIDRTGARAAELVADIARLLTPALVPMGEVRGIGTPTAHFIGYGHSDAVAHWAPVLAEHDDALLAALVDDVLPTPDQCWRRCGPRPPPAWSTRCCSDRRCPARAYRRCSTRSGSSCRRRRRRSRAARTGLRDRTRAGRGEGGLRPVVRRRSAQAAAGHRVPARAGRSRRQLPRPGDRAPVIGAPDANSPQLTAGRSRRCTDWPAYGSATRSDRPTGSTARPTSRRRAWRQSSGHATRDGPTRCTPPWCTSPTRIR